MKKIIVVSVLLLASIVMVTAAVAQKAVTLKIGINAEITGDIPKVGEATKFAAQMWLEDVNKAGGIEVGGRLVHQPQHHQGPPLRVPRLLPG